MSDDDWGDIREAGSSKGIPIWLWGCGGGCLLLILLIVAAGAWTYSFVKDATDPEFVWGEIAEFLPYEERHPEYEALFGNSFLGTGMYVLRQVGIDGEPLEDPIFAVFMLDASEEEGEMSPGSEDQKVDLVVQGEALPAGRFTLSEEDAADLRIDWETGELNVEEIFYVDLSGVSVEEDLQLWLVRDEESEVVTIDEVQHFFEPFLVGPDR